MEINRELPIKQVLIDFVAETHTRAREDRELINYLQGAYNPLPDADPINTVIREVMSYLDLVANQIGPIDKACLAPPSIDEDDNDIIPF